MAAARVLIRNVRRRSQDFNLVSPPGTSSAGAADTESAPADEQQADAPAEMRIDVREAGPYLVHGGVPLVRKRMISSSDGDAIHWEKTDVLETNDVYALCRCGQSSNKPFCDGVHKKVGFEGTEAADTEPTADRHRVHDGTEIVVKRDGSLCMHAGFCVARTRKIPEMMADTHDSDVRAQVIGMIDRCPSGSYVYALEDGGADVEADLPAAIAVTEESDSIAGALWVTGGIPVQRADGEPFETRNRVTLCRCGESSIKPLCDGTHRKIEFRE